MPLEYYLLPSHITPNPDDYLAVSSNSESYTLEDVFRRMTREGSTITTAEALAVFEEITRTIAGIVEEGSSVTTPLVNIRSTVGGVFRSGNDTFDPRRHRVRIHVAPGRRLQKIDGNIPTRKVEVRERRPAPVLYYDNSSDTRNEAITPGRGARIRGSLLKFDESDPGQGIFFIHLDSGEEIRVEAPMLKNKPAELIFLNPDLGTGSYRLEVRSGLNRSTSDEIRAGALPDELTVAGAGP